MSNPTDRSPNDEWRLSGPITTKHPGVPLTCCVLGGPSLTVKMSLSDDRSGSVDLCHQLVVTPSALIGKATLGEPEIGKR